MGKKRKKKTYTTPKKIKNVHVNVPLQTLKFFKVNAGKVERLRDKCNKCNSTLAQHIDNRHYCGFCNE